MDRKILAITGPEWQAALREANGASQPAQLIEHQQPRDAVITLATRPIEFFAVAVEEPAAGAWFDTLLDLTLGDTDKPIPLLMLGQPAAQNRLTGTPILSLPVTFPQLQRGLKQAAINAAQHVAPKLPETFNDSQAIRLRYQPIIRLSDSRPTSVEMLARVQTETGALVGPQAIIAAMINGDHTIALSRLIVQRALRDRIEGEFDALGLAFAFNLPLDAMLHKNLMPVLQRLQKATAITPQFLRFELTETQPVTDLPAIARVLETLRDAGYSVALDDITPFTPNLDALLTLPFKAVKLDRSIVLGALSQKAPTAQRNRHFIEKITTHAQKTQSAVIAEGIETTEARSLMQSLGTTHGQGYLFARPLPANALRPWYTHWLMEPGGK